MSDMPIQDKTSMYSAAIITAVTEAAHATGGPDINAAIAALTDVQAHLIASIKDRNPRRVAEKAATEALGNAIAAKVNERIIRERGAAN